MHSERGNTCDKHSLWEFCGFDVHNYTHTRSCPSFLSSGGARVFMPASTCLLQSKRLSMFFLTLGRFKLDKSPIVGTTASTTCQGQFDVDFQISVEEQFSSGTCLSVNLSRHAGNSTACKVLLPVHTHWRSANRSFNEEGHGPDATVIHACMCEHMRVDGHKMTKHVCTFTCNYPTSRWHQRARNECSWEVEAEVPLAGYARVQE